MEPSPESRPSIREQMDNMLKLRDKLQRDFIHLFIAGGVAGLSFVTLSYLTFPVMSPERYIEVARILGQFHEPVNWALLASGFSGTGVAIFKTARIGMTLSQMRGIQEDLRSREQEET